MQLLSLLGKDPIFCMIVNNNFLLLIIKYRIGTYDMRLSITRCLIRITIIGIFRIPTSLILMFLPYLVLQFRYCNLRFHIGDRIVVTDAWNSHLKYECGKEPGFFVCILAAVLSASRNHRKNSHLFLRRNSINIRYHIS